MNARRFYSRAIVALPLLLGAISLLIAVFNLAGLRDARDTIARGEGDRLLSEFNEWSRDLRRPLLRTDLASFADSRDEVRYIALVRQDGEVLASWGNSGVPNSRSRGRSMTRSGARFRVADVPATRGPGPVRGRGQPGPGEPGDRGGRPDGAFTRETERPRPPGPGRGRRPPGLTHIIEFESPTLAALALRARITTAVNLVVVSCFFAAAFVLRRLLRERELTEAKSAEEQRLRSLGEMSAVMAHELRNPLAALKGNAQLLIEDLEADPSSQERAGRIVHAATRLERLCSDLLEFARVGPLRRAEVGLGELLENCATEVDPTRIRVRVQEGTPRTVWLDANRVRQVLVNLLRNALAASSADQSVDLTVSSSTEWLRFEVLDRGKGIDPSTLDHLFEPFFTTKTEGTGLGLSVANRLAELHGGSLSAENRTHGGARFVLTLPMARRETNT